MKVGETLNRYGNQTNPDIVDNGQLSTNYRMGYVDNVIDARKEKTNFYASYFVNYTEYTDYLNKPQLSDYQFEQFSRAVDNSLNFRNLKVCILKLKIRR